MRDVLGDRLGQEDTEKCGIRAVWRGYDGEGWTGQRCREGGSSDTYVHDRNERASLDRRGDCREGYQGRGVT